jgi:uncharacterized membrane protein
MNPAHLHLMITHLPVLGTLFGLLLLLASFVRGNQELKRISLWVFVLAAIAAVPTYLSGRPANAVLLKLMPGMPNDPGDQHAEVAILALVASSVLGILALLLLVVYRPGKRTPGWATLLTFVLAIATTGLMAWTARLGGNIRHTEVLSPPEARAAR